MPKRMDFIFKMHRAMVDNYEMLAHSIAIDFFAQNKIDTILAVEPNALHISSFFCEMRPKRYAMVQCKVSFWYYPPAPCSFIVHVSGLVCGRIQLCPAASGVTFQ